MKRKMLLALTILLSILMMTACTKNYKALQLTSGDQIPVKVKDTLQEVEFERGIYYFAETFTNESAYLIFCGGEAYADGYDVAINGLDYNVLVSGGLTSPERSPIYGFYYIDYLEESTDTIYDYGFDSEFPIAIFQIDGKIGTQAFPALLRASDLEFINWWGTSAEEFSNEFVKCEIIESEEQVVDIFKDKRIFDVDDTILRGKIGDDAEYLGLIRQDHTPFTVTIENFALARSYSGDGRVDLVLHEHDAVVPMLLYEGIPYVLIKVTHLKDNQYLRSSLVLNKNLLWNLIE